MSQLQSPPEAAVALHAAMLHKARAGTRRTLLLAVAAGAFIALGFSFYVTSQVGADALPWGVAKMLGGVAFGVGLLSVVLAGADLFTSTTMTLMGRAERQLSWHQVLRHWGLVYVGNALGALFVMLVLWGGGVQDNAGGAWGEVLVATAQHKLDHSFARAFLLGVGCNMLVCIAVWLAGTGRTAVDKAIALAGPVAIFVSLGMEHSVANMFLLPYGVLVQGGGAGAWLSIVTANLVPVTLGNIVGGGVVVGLFTWWVRRVSGRDPVPDA